MDMEERKLRSLIKAIIYRIMHWFIHFGFFYVLTNEPIISGLAGIASNITCFVSYYFYERLWNKIEWGKSK